MGLRSYGDTRHAPRLAAGGPVAQGRHCGTGAAHTAESIHLAPGGLAFLLATQHPAATLSGGKEGISRHEKCFGSFSWKAVVANCLIFLFIFLIGGKLPYNVVLVSAIQLESAWSNSEREKQISYINTYIWNLTCLLSKLSSCSLSAKPRDTAPMKVQEPSVLNTICKNLLLFSFFGMFRMLKIFLKLNKHFSSVQSLSRVWLFLTPWTAARQANSWTLLKLTCIKSVMPSNHLILCHPLSPPTLSLSQHQGLFQWISSSHHITKVLEFQLQ